MLHYPSDILVMMEEPYCERTLRCEVAVTGCKFWWQSRSVHRHCCRFALPHRQQLLGLPIGQHISLKADTQDGPMLLRPYTPVTDHNQRGLVDFVIKVSGICLESAM